MNTTPTAHTPIAPNTPKTPPNAGSYDWAKDVLGADSFVFRGTSARDTSPAEFA